MHYGLQCCGLSLAFHTMSLIIAFALTYTRALGLGRSLRKRVYLIEHGCQSSRSEIENHGMVE